MLEQFFIINRSGGMVYQYENNMKTDTNVLLVLTGSLHSINEMTRSYFKTEYYLQKIRLSNKSISIYKTLTGFTFVFVMSGIDNINFEKVYDEFCTFVLGNPFYQLDMPINLSKFEPFRYLEKNKKKQ